MTFPKDKYLFYVLGGPGSGKSSIMQFIDGTANVPLNGNRELEFLLNKVSMLSFDKITLDTLRNQMSNLPSPASKHPHPEKMGAHLNKYKALRNTDFYSSFKKAANIYMDDHGDLHQQDQSFLRLAKANGYKIVLVNLAISPEDYMARQAASAKQHNYDPMRHIHWAVDLFKSSEDAFTKLSSLADNAFLLERQKDGSFVVHNTKRLNQSQQKELSNRTSWKKVKVKHLKKQSHKFGL